MLITDGYGNARVHRFAASGEHVSSWGEPGGGPGQFVLPHSLIIDPQGRILVADRENHRIQVFDSDGEVLDIWTDIRLPQDMALDSAGNLFLAQANTGRAYWTWMETCWRAGAVRRGGAMTPDCLSARTVSRSTPGEFCTLARLRNSRRLRPGLTRHSEVRSRMTMRMSDPAAARSAAAGWRTRE